MPDLDRHLRTALWRERLREAPTLAALAVFFLLLFGAMAYKLTRPTEVGHVTGVVTGVQGFANFTGDEVVLVVELDDGTSVSATVAPGTPVRKGDRVELLRLHAKGAGQPRYRLVRYLGRPRE